MGAFAKSDLLSDLLSSDDFAIEGFAHFRKMGGRITPGIIKRRFAELYVFTNNAMPINADLPSLFYGFMEEDEKGELSGREMTLTDENWLNKSFSKALKKEAWDIAADY